MVDKSPLFYMRVYSEESTSEDWGGYFTWGGVEVVADTVQILYNRYAGERTSQPIFLQNLAEIYESYIVWEVEGDLKIIEGEMVINPDDLLYYRLHLEGNDVYTERLVDGFWVDREFLFTYPGEPGRWFDLTFDQLGREFVSWEIDGQVWIYWYNSVNQQMEIWNVCPGRTPVCSIDTYHEYQSDISDILLFYIDDEADRVKYRLQRDRYGVEYETKLKGYLYPVEQPNATDKDLIYAHMASNWRFYLWYRIKTREEFTISYWHSAIYPIPVPMKDARLKGALLKDATNTATVWWYYPELSDTNLTLGAYLSSGQLVSSMLTVYASEGGAGQAGEEVGDEGAHIGGASLVNSYLMDSILRAAILTHTIEDTKPSLAGAYLLDARKELIILRSWQDDYAELGGAYLVNASLVEAA